MKLDTLLKSCREVKASNDGIHWYPLRPETAENTFIWHRIKAAWLVLTGKADAVEWNMPEK